MVDSQTYIRLWVDCANDIIVILSWMKWKKVWWYNFTFNKTNNNLIKHRYSAQVKFTVTSHILKLLSYFYSHSILFKLQLTISYYYYVTNVINYILVA